MALVPFFGQTHVGLDESYRTCPLVNGVLARFFSCPVPHGSVGIAWMFRLMHTCIKLYLESKMRTTVTIEDALFEKALELADPKMDRADIFREAMKTFVRVQAARRLAALGGAMPEMPDIPRRSTELAAP